MEISQLSFGTRPQCEWSFPQDSHLAPNLRRRLDVYVDDLELSPRPQGFDVTVISPHSRPYSTMAKTTPRDALKRAEGTKRSRYDSLCSELQMDFHPMAFYVYGNVGPGTEQAIHLLSDFSARRRGTNPADERRTLLLRLCSLVLQRTAVAVNRRMIDFST